MDESFWMLPLHFLTRRSKFVSLIRAVYLKLIVLIMKKEFQTVPYEYNTTQ